MAARERRLRVEVAFAGADHQTVVAIQVAPGTTAAEAVRRSGILERHPDADPDRDGLGLFGRIVSPDRPVEDGDRIEIYRPLQVDPKEARRRRARR